MSNPGEPMPPDRERVYSAIAEQTIREAVEPLVGLLSQLAVADAVELAQTAGDIDGHGLVEGVVAYAAATDLAAEVTSEADRTLMLANDTRSVAERIGEQLAMGNDEEIRGLTVNKDRALQRPQAYPNEDGTWGEGEWRISPVTGNRQFRSLDGRWVDEVYVDQGYSRWAGNPDALKAALTYEVRKAQSVEEVATIAHRFLGLAFDAGGWGLDPTQACELWDHASLSATRMSRADNEAVRAKLLAGSVNDGAVLRPARVIEQQIGPGLIRPASWEPLHEFPDEE